MSKQATRPLKRAAIPADRKRLEEHVRFLSGLHPPRNHLNLSSLNAAAGYILEEFRRCGAACCRQEFSVGGREYHNVVATFAPHLTRRLVLGAHYDVCGDTPGADDNASAVAGLLEIGKLVSELKPDLACRLDCVAYPLEEPPHFGTQHMGSAVHARSLAKEKIRLEGMICLESIGFFTDRPRSQRYPLGFLNLKYPSRGNFIALVGKMGQKRLLAKIQRAFSEISQLGVEAIVAPSFLPGIDLSDHRSYWACGYPAVMVTDTALYRNPQYHQPGDTADTLDFEKMAEVVRGVYWALASW